MLLLLLDAEGHRLVAVDDLGGQALYTCRGGFYHVSVDGAWNPRSIDEQTVRGLLFRGTFSAMKETFESEEALIESVRGRWMAAQPISEVPLSEVIHLFSTERRAAWEVVEAERRAQQWLMMRRVEAERRAMADAAQHQPQEPSDLGLEQAGIAALMLRKPRMAAKFGDVAAIMAEAEAFAVQHHRELGRAGLAPEEFAQMATTQFWMAEGGSSAAGFVAFMKRLTRKRLLEAGRRTRSRWRRLVRYRNELGQDFDLQEAADRSTEDPVEAYERKDLLEHAMAYLRECGRDGEWFTLKYIQGCNYHDIATSYGVSRTTVKEFFRKKSARCNAIKQRIKEILTA